LGASCVSEVASRSKGAAWAPEATQTAKAITESPAVASFIVILLFDEIVAWNRTFPSFRGTRVPGES
jgi:hypothetical protein